eukprot:CAMPEP_0113319172 /NCGR_PEP_ID=MMETSP0010_2-20120614/13474_1 /TAXON_ID=216773 ORGANISM="Corethron hystrix, Strain 308" /NCGR_SAMPLE_ID=MMETSP0010_2 /ASSEMBLY_ACC=CAM_ASM_000155 /LENGTH=126 /DNA_ID=CAMNT_0000176675 /DNA_START=605 /DNA_END=982 /DNA_ORIENTATION=+ /assembly_acc=CAM_ASM_000155
MPRGAQNALIWLKSHQNQGPWKKAPMEAQRKSQQYKAKTATAGVSYVNFFLVHCSSVVRHFPFWDLCGILWLVDINIFVRPALALSASSTSSFRFLFLDDVKTELTRSCSPLSSDRILSSGNRPPH